MADLRTTITEVVTALGTLGDDDLDNAMRAPRPAVLHNVDDAVWSQLQDAWAAPGQLALFHAAWSNGRAFFTARDALRGRRPDVVEWKGAHRAPGDEVVPADLRVDHVYFVSCKYLSKIVVNASPHYLFERLLTGPQGRRGVDWFQEVAAPQHQALYDAVHHLVDDLPRDVTALDTSQRRSLAKALQAGWPPGAIARYQALVDRTAMESARRWRSELRADAEPM